MTVPTFSPDARLEDADWTKQAWDLPPYMSKEFQAQVPDLDVFRRSPVYAHAVANGLIFDDEWVGDYVNINPGTPPAPRRKVHIHIHRKG